MLRADCVSPVSKEAGIVARSQKRRPSDQQEGGTQGFAVYDVAAPSKRNGWNEQKRGDENVEELVATDCSEPMEEI